MADRIVQCREVTLGLREETLAYWVETKGVRWEFDTSFMPKITFSTGSVAFQDAKEITHHQWKTGVGEGIRTSYRGFSLDGVPVGLALDTIVWVEEVSGDVLFEIAPMQEGPELLRSVHWPAPIQFSKDCADWYTLVNLMQGLLVPNNWPNEFFPLHFEGMFGSTAAYMPWWGQIRPEGGCQTICQEFWDAAYEVEHPAGGPHTRVNVRWVDSLGKLSYRRTLRYRFFGACDHNDLCKSYRQYAKERGLVVTLREKAVRLPKLHDLVGSAVVHTGIKTHVSPDSRYFKPGEPEKNDKLVSFATRAQQMKALHAAGLKKAYLHLDGWGQPGYDNQHPDYLPACKEAGGWEGLRDLSKTVEQLGFLFGVHDQYRDFYFDAPSFDRDFALRDPEGNITDFCIWAGGRQSYICATQSPYYLRRNFTELLAQGVHLDCTYLDVFTCNDGDQCTHPWHTMTRKECFEYRVSCFMYLTSLGILPSSEEVTDWSLTQLVFAHYGPHDFELFPQKPRRGIPVPLFNLVYHDCALLPWKMNPPGDCHDAVDGSTGTGGEDEMLYALLNGGAPYLNCELEGEALTTALRRCKTVTDLQERVALLEMTRHQLLDSAGKRQKSWFSDGTTVSVNFETGEYEIQ